MSELGPLEYLQISPNKNFSIHNSKGVLLEPLPFQNRKLFLGGRSLSKFSKEHGLYQLLLQRRAMKLWPPEDSYSNPVDAYVHPAYKVIKAFFLQEKTSLVVSEGLDESGYLKVQVTLDGGADIGQKPGCMLYFVNPGEFEWTALEKKRGEGWTSGTLTRIDCGGFTEFLCRQTIFDYFDTKYECAVITDGTICAIIEHNGYYSRHLFLPLAITSVSNIPIRRVIAVLLFSSAHKHKLVCAYDLGDRVFRPYLGALNAKNSNTPSYESCRRFSDFDVYSMQRSFRRFEGFLDWYDEVRSPEHRRHLQIGDSLGVDVNEFSLHNFHLKPIVYTTTVPEDTSQYFEQRTHRPRANEVDDLLQTPTSATPSFKITKLVRTGEGKYSQVFFGELGNTGVELCLKLFDERYFMIPSVDDSWYGEVPRLRPEKRLADFNTAEDMIRRELAAYEGCKLKQMQGNMIPHCYGAHQFTLPDGWKAYGLLLEAIPGPSLFDTSPQPYKMSCTAQISLIKQLRHCTRMFKLCGVEQTDWHSEQVICMPRGDSMDENTETFNYEMVLIDFAFTLQRLEGEGYGLPPTIDVKHPRGILAYELAMPLELLDEHWGDNYMDDEF